MKYCILLKEKENKYILIKQKNCNTAEQTSNKSCIDIAFMNNIYIFNFIIRIFPQLYSNSIKIKRRGQKLFFNRTGISLIVQEALKQIHL